MHISEIRIRNYRNFTKTKVFFNNNDSVILGENGSGKTNLFRVIRLVLDNRYNTSIKQDDFPAIIKFPKANWIIIQVKFIGVDTRELGIFGVKINPNDNKEAWINFFFRPVYEVRQKIELLSQKIKSNEKNVEDLNDFLAGLDIRTDYESIKTVGEIPDYTNDNEYFQLVGDMDNLNFAQVLEEDDKTKTGNTRGATDVIRHINIISIPAGRNPFDEMTGSTGIIKNIISKRQSSIPKEKLSVLRDNLNKVSETIESFEEFKGVAEQVNKTFQDTLGDVNTKKANISSLISDEINDMFKYLGLNIEDGNSKLPLYYRSLGEQSIFHLVLRMIDSESSEKIKFTMLLVEEPEVHLHTHLQRTLFVNLQNKTNMQLLLSTHSSNISYSASISKMIILDLKEKNTEVFYPARNLTTDLICKTERYLDANRTPLLFAKRVMLVEGDAEAIILPWLFKKHYNHTLDEYTVSLIKVDSTFFLPISQLFHEERINRKCYIITDRDKDYTSSKENADSDKIGITRMKDLLLQQNNNSCIIPSFALNTFEIQFYKKNIDILKRMLDTKLIYKQEARIVEIKGNLDSDNNEDVCKAIMKCVMHVKKGWMALTLIDYCETNAIIPQIPHYIGKVFKKVVL